jgi:predicted  nucleic acid-binding Zn-ribbon protein
MVSFPILERLDIDNYGLYPGSEKAGTGLHIEFGHGLTLVLGANGLGKTTLVSIIYRLLSGPFDISGLDTRSELGSRSLEARPLQGTSRTLFAQRVMDGARTSSAHITFRLGSSVIVVGRRLNDLALTKLSIDGVELGTVEIDNFHKEILRLAGVWSFGDWILVLRHLLFYFEDRRALVWDASAQRQLLRLLFLPIATAQRWTEDERTILELDSRVRNLSAALTREERSLSSNEYKFETGGDVRQELKSFENFQRIDREQQESRESEVVALDVDRQNARLQFLKAQQEREARFRELERARLTAISARFPAKSETARYILAQLMSDSTCLVCDHVATDAAKNYSDRIHSSHCVVCGTDLSSEEQIVPEAGLADKRVEKLTSDLTTIEIELESAQEHLTKAEKAFEICISDIQQLNTEIARRSQKIDELVRRLPPEEAKLRTQRTELASMRAHLETLKVELSQKRGLFREFIEKLSRQLAANASAIKEAFDALASGFLIESIRLVWAPQKATVGQLGEAIEYPAFELEMSSAGFSTLVRRNGPDQVSESQREFIDLAFRMALMSVASSSKSGSLIIDAPESSLDAVFVTRASDVLARFALSEAGNRLIITSNLVEGRLIPDLIAKSTKGMSDTEKQKRLVNLFDIAAPTAAVTAMRSEYDSVLRNLTEVS